LPETIVKRPKQGFALPLDAWMRGPLREFCSHHLSAESLGDTGLFNAKALDDTWQAFLAGDRRLTWSRPWALVALGAWLERHDVCLG